MDRQSDEVKIVGVDWGCYKSATGLVKIMVRDGKCEIVGMANYETDEADERSAYVRVVENVARFIEESGATLVATDCMHTVGDVLSDMLRSKLWERKLDVAVVDYVCDEKKYYQLRCAIGSMQCPIDPTLPESLKPYIEAFVVGKGKDWPEADKYPFYLARPLAVVLWAALDAKKMEWMCHA